MKGTKEYRSWVKRLVKRFGKKNGNVKGFLFDNPEQERKDANNKRQQFRKERSNNWNNEQ